MPTTISKAIWLWKWKELAECGDKGWKTLSEGTHATELVLDRPGFSETFDLLDSTWLLQVVTSLS